MNRHQRHLSQAIAVAASSRHPRWSIGAVVVRAGNIVAAAANTPRNPAWLVEGVGSSLHAEAAALRRLKGSADGSVAYVARINRSGLTRLARPCPACFDGLVRAGIKAIVYTTDDGYGTEKLHTP